MFTKIRSRVLPLVLAAASPLAFAGAVQAQNGVAHPAHKAKISLAQAEHTATARVPGTVVDHELEHERGRWIYSIEIRPKNEPASSTLVKEVNVNADTGEIVNVENEHEKKGSEKPAHRR